MFKAAAIKDYAPLIGSAVGALAGIVGTEIVRNSLQNKMKEEIESDKSKGFSRKNVTDEVFLDIKQKAGLQDLQHRVHQNFENAMYVPPGAVSDKAWYKKEISKRLKSKNPRIVQSGLFLNDVVNFSNTKDGGIILGGKFTNPFIIGHEVGHAMIDKEKTVPGFFQKNYNLLSNLGLGASALGFGTQLYGTYSGSEELKNIGSATGWTGLGVAAANEIGRLIYENEASKKSMDLLEKTERIKDLDPDQIKRLRDASFQSYLLGPASIALPVAGSLAGSYIGGKMF